MLIDKIYIRVYHNCGRKYASTAAKMQNAIQKAVFPLKFFVSCSAAKARKITAHFVIDPHICPN